MAARAYGSRAYGIGVCRAMDGIVGSRTLLIGVSRMRSACDVLGNALAERHGLGIAKVGVRLEIAVAVVADCSLGVALAERCQDDLPFRRGEAPTGGLGRGVQRLHKRVLPENVILALS